ncbi:choice-of-anchor C family protein [Litoreibacter roseus]|uniref:DUF642 domain-containing protein n=1 Tax=Litoreibacter roseus TaxID=2601869 RepID=A0A6N6JE89_9RHOB|nr:choice-of-anchor C family protein [Litoreibacter roseus]GFE64150.1 hypothetical protein KIN_12240 [Litoreibacter roseus]
MKYVIAAALMCVAGSAGAATIANGDFDQPGTFNGGFQTLGAGSTGLSGWTIGGSGIDLINTYWTPQADDYSIDLNAGNAGTISQTITDMIVGTAYDLTFWMSGNPAGGPAEKQIDVSVGFSGETFTYDVTGNSRSNMNWEEMTFSFVADSTEALLVFSSGISGAFGGALDSIAISETGVSPIPVPASLPLLAGGLALLGLARRRKA